MSLADDVQQQQQAAVELEAATLAWRSAQQVERVRYEQVLQKVRQARTLGIKVHHIVEVTAISRSDLYNKVLSKKHVKTKESAS